MTLVSSLITDAFRETNILPLGVAPNANQLAEALRLFNQNIKSLYGSEAGENLRDWPLGTLNYSDQPNMLLPSPYMLARPPINRRLIATNTAPITLYLTDHPQDGSRYCIIDPFGNLAANPVTINGNGRPIEGSAALVLNTNNDTREWIYRADLGSWEKLTSLLSTDQNPFPDEFDIFFYIGLAMRLNPRYGREMDPQTAEVFKSQRSQVITRYLQSMPLEIDDSLSWPFLSHQSFNQQRGFTDSSAFNRGWYGGS